MQNWRDQSERDINLPSSKEELEKLRARYTSNKKKSEEDDEKALFKLTELFYENLRKDGLPEDLLIKLKSIVNQSYTDESDFLEAVEKAIGSEQTFKYKSAILKSADKNILRISNSESKEHFSHVSIPRFLIFSLLTMLIVFMCYITFHTYKLQKLIIINQKDVVRMEEDIVQMLRILTKEISLIQIKNKIAVEILYDPSISLSMNLKEKQHLQLKITNYSRNVIKDIRIFVLFRQGRENCKKDFYIRKYIDHNESYIEKIKLKKIIEECRFKNSSKDLSLGDYEIRLRYPYFIVIGVE
jgi:hypothetical protein